MSLLGVFIFANHLRRDAAAGLKWNSRAFGDHPTAIVSISLPRISRQQQLQSVDSNSAAERGSATNLGSF